MALLLRNGDYVPDNKGSFQTVQGAQEVLERILWTLSLRRGGFPLLPGLGSRLHLLPNAPARQREALAKEYVREALRDEEVTVEEVRLAQEGDRCLLHLRLTWRGEALTAALEVGGEA